MPSGPLPRPSSTYTRSRSLFILVAVYSIVSGSLSVLVYSICPHLISLYNQLFVSSSSIHPGFFSHLLFLSIHFFDFFYAPARTFYSRCAMHACMHPFRPFRHHTFVRIYLPPYHGHTSPPLSSPYPRACGSPAPHRAPASRPPFASLSACRPACPPAPAPASAPPPAAPARPARAAAAPRKG